MDWFIRKVAVISAIAIAASAVCLETGVAQEVGAPGAGQIAAVAPLWPSRFAVGDDAFTVYPPQLERWAGNRLEGRAAVAVQVAGAQAPVFGTVSLSARTEIDSGSGMVTVHDIAAGSGSFPTALPRAGAYLEAVRRHVATLTWQVALSHLQGDLAIDQAAQRSRSEPLRNDPPRIVYVQSPTILVPIDGAPVLREVAGTSLLRVVNTRALILQDPVANRYFLYVAGYWLEAPSLADRWTQSQVRPLALEEIKEKALADGSVDLLDDDGPASTRIPKVIVSTGPTELVQTDGPPQYAPVGSTDLLFVTNSPSRLFLDLRSQMHYVLLAGRWYRTTSLARGAWDYVPGADLPPDFAMIPEEHPTASVRASVPGTPQAQESAIANSVPDIATVKRSAARLEITYDGAPEFRPIQGTPLEAAANAPVPVIRVDSHTYYALDNGVWFSSNSADGPWTAAASVPAAIYTIPRDDPLHYVTYVRVYDANNEEIYVGYTPGYIGSYVTPESTVVYGTGWYYRPWIGSVWYPAPVTWGFGFSFYYSWWSPWWGPWPVRAWWPAWRPVPCFRPAWGPWPYQHVGVKTFGVAVIRPIRPPGHGHVAVFAGSRGHGRGAFVENGGIYRRWDAHGGASGRFGSRQEAVRAADRSPTFQTPLPRQRDDRRSATERGHRFADNPRPQMDSPRWIRPDDRASVHERSQTRPESAPARSVAPTQGASPGQSPANRPSSRMWSNNRNASEWPSARRFDGPSRLDGQRSPGDARRWGRRDDSPAAVQDSRPSMAPPTAQQPARASPTERRSPGPDRAREFRAPPRRQVTDRDWTSGSAPASALGPSMRAPATTMRSAPDASRGPRNGPGFGPR